MTRHLVIAAALGVALVSPALAGTKPTAPILRLAAPIVGQHTFTGMNTTTLNCSGAVGVPVSAAGRCFTGRATPIIGIVSPGTFTKPDSLNFDRSELNRCTSTVASPVAAAPACAAKANVNAFDFSADSFTRTNLRVDPPIIVIRCSNRSAVPTPVPPWCRATNNNTSTRGHAVPVIYYRHHWDPPQFGFGLQLGNAAPRIFGTINQ